MRDLALQVSGVFAIMAAVAHGILGETRVFARAHIEPAWARRLIRAVWQCSSVAWLACGVLLLAAPLMSSEAARRWIIFALVPVYAVAAVGNAWATRGRHFGWMVLTAVVVCALFGL
ncbi:MAG: hypothetical protein ACLPKB_11890 [Xanthobacteraceae bacterium]